MNMMDVIRTNGARIVGGSEYQWACYGPNARFLDFADVTGNEHSSIVHDAKNYVVYEMTVNIPGQEQAFKWHNPDFREAFVAEATQRGQSPDNAWDNVDYELVDEATILAYAKDVGELYYDDLPIPKETA
jgi:hypothetical protein